MARGAVTAPFLLVAAPFLVIDRLFARWRAWLERRATRRLIRSRPMFDYGAATTVRQEGMSASYSHYFQKLDELMYFKLIQKQIFESIVTFLDARGIDTSELKERQGAVLNNGVIITGGEIKAQNLAVGARARAGQFLKTGSGTAQGGQPPPPPTPRSN